MSGCLAITYMHGSTLYFQTLSRKQSAATREQVTTLWWVAMLLYVLSWPFHPCSLPVAHQENRCGNPLQRFEELCTSTDSA